MKKQFTLFWSLMTLCLLFSAFKPHQHEVKVHTEEKGHVVVEAEDFYKQTNTDQRKWFVVDKGFTTDLKANDGDLHTQGANGGKYIEILPDTRTNHDEKLIVGVNFSNEPGKIGILHYKVDFSTPGRYYVWVRAYSTGSEDNGVHVGVDGTWPESGQRMQWCEGKDAWTWGNNQRTEERHCGIPGFIYLDIDKAGEHDIQFSMREDGFEMDQFILTKDSTFHPQKEETGSSDNKGLLATVKDVRPSAKIYPAQWFKSTKNSFYNDKEWLAIDPEKFKEAEASLAFDGAQGDYDVVLFTVGENDGRSVYTLKKNDQSFQDFRTPLSSNMFEEGLEYAKVYSNIKLNADDVIGVKAVPKSRDGKEFSRARWSGLVLVKAGTGKKLIQELQQEMAARTQMQITGELKKWHKVTLTFDGPNTSEDADYNPFMNYRFNVTFTHKQSGKSYLVPGYYAADGDAGQSSAKEGNKWRVHFAPDETGEWTYKVDFRKGNYAAVSTKPNTGLSGSYMDGATGSFKIGETDKTGKDFRAKGRLQYVGERYLKFAETGEYFLKQGPDAPENFLSYADLDGTFKNDGHKDNMVKTWSAHLQDYKQNDPTWKNGKGKAIIGALNYLASKGLNSVSFLTNNIAGDDQNVFPYVDYDTYDRIDISKMDQWEIIFEHAQKLGLFLHFKMLEVENQGLLDNGGVGANTKLYFRELMARFGHHLALNWNLCEENGEWVSNPTTPPQETEQRLAMTAYFKKNDPYHHHLVIHNGIEFDDLLGPDSGLTGPSVQTNKEDFSRVHKAVLHWLDASKKAGFQWAVAVDEPGDAQHSLITDGEDPDHDNARRNALWGTFMAGGWGNEWYFGYAHPHSDLTCEDYRSRDLFWDQAVHAMDFFKNNDIPFWETENRNDLVGNSKNENTVYCLAKENEVYVVYLNSQPTAQLDLSHASGEFEVLWFNPKKGGDLKKSKVKKVSGGGMVDLGKSPDKKQLDWTILVRRAK
ncbi:DUF5060 domain-containing protein [Zobellia uliginosa]|uniref:DUF5060 domain-containing protein n=1 Tax=Zobellia uliginosa TaxID=143224 RepID=UPI0026E4228E|nr:DUF5060 domain-containing protein [Zobellia uliginosa]MDO6518245.1 DUF5060 domain-containing protein [Zobellia uliginosa]